MSASNQQNSEYEKPSVKDSHFSANKFKGKKVLEGNLYKKRSE